MSESPTCTSAQCQRRGSDGISESCLPGRGSVEVICFYSVHGHEIQNVPCINTRTWHRPRHLLGRRTSRQPRQAASQRMESCSVGSVWPQGSKVGCSNFRNGPAGILGRQFAGEHGGGSGGLLPPSGPAATETARSQQTALNGSVAAEPRCRPHSGGYSKQPKPRLSSLLAHAKGCAAATEEPSRPAHHQRRTILPGVTVGETFLFPSPTSAYLSHGTIYACF